jgi:hypothetical protein
MGMKVLLYRPFSTEEVATICRVETRLLDDWMMDVLPIQTDREGRLGLDYMGLLAVFAAKKWLAEGSGLGRAIAVMHFVMATPLSAMEHNFRDGNTFPAPREQLEDNGVEVPPGVVGVLVYPPKGRLGATLNLKVIRGEMDDRLARLYPSGWERR